MRRLLLSLAAVAALFLSVSCGSYNPIPKLTGAKQATEQKIEALKADHAKEMEGLRAQERAKTEQLLADKDAQMHRAGTGLYSADLAFKTILAPTRTDLVVNNYVNEAWTALGRPMPTYAEMQEANQRLKDELDEAKTSIAQLQQNHAAAMAQNQALVDATLQHQRELSAVRTEMGAKEAAFNSQLQVLQVELKTVTDKLIATEQARADDRAALQALKTKASTALGILGLVAVAAAIYLPVFRTQCAGFGALCLLGAGAIWIIEPWMVGVAVAACVLGLIGWMALKHRREERVADALILANQDLKERDPQLWEKHLKPAVTDRLARYRKGADGKFVTERDPSLERHIDAKLAEFDALPVAPTKNA